MVYLFEGKDRFLIQEKIKKIVKNFSIEKDEIEYYNSKSDIITVLQSARSFSFFSDKKMIIYEEPSFLTQQDASILFEKYLEQKNEQTIMIIVCSALDGRKKITSLLKKNTTYELVESLNYKNKRAYILNLLKNNDINMSNDLLQDFVLKMPLNSGIIQKEVEKLILNKIEISKDLIHSLICDYYDDSTFEFVDIILNQNLKNSLKYFERLKSSNSVMQIIGALASKVRLIYQVSILNQNYVEKDIVSILNSKPYPVKLAYDYIYKKPSIFYLKMLFQLSELSYDIRHGKIDANLGFELFLINREEI